MTISDLKMYIYENKKIQDILEKLGCHNIKYNNILNKNLLQLYFIYIQVLFLKLLLNYFIIFICF